MNFAYGSKETEYLKRKDGQLGVAIDTIGHIDRAVDVDLFSAVVHHILGQQVSTKMQGILWKRMTDALGEVTAETVLAAGRDKVQSFGTTFKKAGYIIAFAERVHDGSFDIEAVERMTDDEAIEALTALPGVGVWTAEMLLLFCLQRPDVLSFSDYGVQRGLRMIYGHSKIDKETFKKYRERFSPYGSVASLYLWAVSGGAIPKLKDPAPAKKKKERAK